MKTVYSGRFMSIDSGMLELLKSWRQTTQFSGDNDWVFASPVKLGRLPVSYPWVWKVFQRAGTQAGIGKLGTSTQLSFMAGRGRNCDCRPAEVDAALGYLSVLEVERASREKVGPVKKEVGQGNSPLAVATFRDDLSLYRVAVRADVDGQALSPRRYAQSARSAIKSVVAIAEVYYDGPGPDPDYPRTETAHSACFH